MNDFKNLAFEKFNTTKIPFIIYLTILILPELILPEFFSISSDYSFVFWILHYIFVFWVFGWLLTTWLTSNSIISEHKIPNIFSSIVRRVFFLQVKITIIGYLLVLPLTVLITILYISVFSGNPDEIKSLQIYLLGKGDLVEPGRSFFLQSLLFTILLPMIIVFVIYFRCSYAILSLFRNREKISLLTAWKKSKGTTLIAIKLLIPFIIISLLFTYIAFYIYSIYPDDTGLDIMFTIISTIIIFPIFFQALTKYFLTLMNK